MAEPLSESRRGFLLGVAAYVMWGAFPLYWPLLEPAGAFEILAHRIVWSLVTMGVLVVALSRTASFRRVASDGRVTRLLAVAACVITVNWATYIWGVTNGHVVETSLGYFINPLVTVLMGVFILGERLRPWQWAAMGVAGSAVVVLTVDYGRLPWVALVLAFSFGSYGLCKKQAGAPAIESLTFETMVIGPVALAYVVWLGATGGSHLTGHGLGHVLLFASTGIVTAIPLICFGGAAIRVSMVTLGLLQYLAPDPAVRPRGPLLPREHAGRALGRLPLGVGRPGDLHRRVAAPSPPYPPTRRRGRARLSVRPGELMRA